MSDSRSYNIIISGGGTGGHIFPAIAIADSLKKELPNVKILFVGAKGRMEMEKVPNAGYDIVGLYVVGFQRGKFFKNLLFPIKLLVSLWKAFSIIRNFSPDIVIGVGGYASGPTLFMASLQRIPTVIQEQNFFPGVTNKILSRWVQKIFVAYQGMDRFFPKDKIIYTGNPVRESITMLPDRKTALQKLGWDDSMKVVFVMGGSLGARTINESIMPYIHVFEEKKIRVIWQTGKLYYSQIIEKVGDISEDIKIFEFIKDMNVCYAAADIIVSRAGALSISELCIVSKPVILVPSPNVAENHQTHNAMALVDSNAAIMISDSDAVTHLVPSILTLLENEEQQNNMSIHIKTLARPYANQEIVTHIINILN
jgi:UDP-N-acetylglucosamine--N-acetylmuramyl-(pentapeptide) pyrophosphoryl-undecaprenol N-acetylglucosamine transferase